MISKIHSTTVVVADQAEALAFYVDVLGWEKAMDVPMSPELRWLTVVPPGAATQLVLAQEQWAGDAHRRGGHTGVTLIADDIDAAYAELSGRGVRFKGPVQPMPWGSKGTWFFDVDDNEFFLTEE